MQVNVRRCVLDGQTVTSIEKFYDELTRQLPFPRHFGRNLDALWDVLTVDLPGPVELTWENAALSRKAMGGDYELLVELLREAAEERGDLKVFIQMH